MKSFSDTVSMCEPDSVLASVRLVSKSSHSKVYVCHARGGRRMCLKVLFADARVLEHQKKLLARIMKLEAVSEGGLPLPTIYGCSLPLGSESCKGAPSRQGLYVVSDWIEGASLAEIGGSNSPLATRRRGTLAKTLNLLRSLADAVDGLTHLDGGAALVHGDLKPSNIIVSLRSGLHVTLIDLDTAAFLDDLPCAIPCGTFGYAPPEAVVAQDGPAGLDTTSDVFSFGVVAHEMLAGRWPYPFPRTLRDRGFWAAFFEGKGEMAIAPNLPDDIRQFLSACLSLDPNARPTPSDLRKYLDRVLAGYGGEELLAVPADWADVSPTPSWVKDC